MEMLTTEKRELPWWSKVALVVAIAAPLIGLLVSHWESVKAFFK
jgi:hypothetical protein